MIATMQRNWRKYLSVREWPLTAFIVMAVMVGNILAVTYYFSYNQIRESDNWVSYTQGNIARVLEFSAALQEAIVAQQTYLSLGNRALKPEAVTKFEALTARLKSVLDRVHYEDSQNALAEMRYELDALQKMSQKFMEAREKGNLAAAYDPKDSASFFALANHIQQNADAIRQTEKKLLDARLQRAENSQSYYVGMMLIASLFSLAVVVVLSWLMIKLRGRHEVMSDELRVARERFELAMKGSNDGLFDWTPNTNELYLSPRMKEMYGYKPHELENSLEAMKAIIHPEDFADAFEDAQRYLRREQPAYQHVYRVRHKDGTWRWVMSRGAAQWNSKGVPTRMVGIHTDVTSLKQMEDELREAKQRADSANRAKSNFLANMSHEIRTPMNAIIGIAGIMHKRTDAKSPQREYIDALNIASKSLFALINDLLDLSKLDDGSLKLEQLPFNPRQVLEEAATLARVKSDEKRITLDVQVRSNVPAMLVGDAYRLRQIVNNLLSNAVKFTDQGGVTLMAGLTPVGHLEIRVKDTGIGIPKEARKTIFEKFTQSDPSITRRFGGTGLGLSICRELAELMGGDIELLDTNQQGTEFVVTLPLPTASTGLQPDIQEPQDTSDASNAARGCVLLVEDYKPNILVARTVLASMGYACDAVSTGGDAVARLTGDMHDQYVAVLMDVQLPDISGVDATKRVRSFEAENKRHRVPIIAMTAHALMGDREKFIADGMDAYIPKPFDPEDLSEKLQNLALPPRKTAA